jgi:uncharacterized protein YigE (DUF2233 family)
MHKKNLIAIDEFCASHHVEVTFIRSLYHTGLIQINTIEEKGFIDAGQLQQLEKIIRLYYEMDINLEGIEAIHHLLQKIISQNKEIIALNNRLGLYETDLAPLI